MKHDRYQGIPVGDLRIASIDWTHRAQHIRSRSARAKGDFDVEPKWATEAALDPERVLRMTGGFSLEVIGYSPTAGRVLKVWIVPKELSRGDWWGGSACLANRRDQRRYERVR